MYKTIVSFAFLSLIIGIVSGQQINNVNPTLPAPNTQLPTMLNDGLQGDKQTQINRQVINSDLTKYFDRRKRQQSVLSEVDLAFAETESKGIIYRFPESTNKGRSHYMHAFQELSDMLAGNTIPSIKKAVFAVEHAFDTSLNSNTFSQDISEAVTIIGEAMRLEKLNARDNTAKIMALFRYMTDTLSVYLPSFEKKVTSYPKTYDFEDFWGRKDYRKMFVSKLITSGSGQCHSLPLLFLILCEETDATAYLSFAPNHSFIKFQDRNGKWHNLELTSGMLASDHFMVQSGYIKAEALQSGIYLQPVSVKETIAQCLNDLALGYIKQHGYDSFVTRCTSTVLAYYGDNLTSHQINANYFSELATRIIFQYKVRGLGKAQLEKDEEAMSIITSAIGATKRIEKLGFSDMPADAYES